MKTKDFMESYMKIKELDDEEIIGELRRWYTTNATECPLCNKMILKKEAVKYDKEFTGEICKSCSEREENDVSEAELRDLFQENILLNMATADQMKRIFENALGYPPNTLDAVIGAGAHLVDRIENAGNEAGGIINIPLFYG
ncbi:hypothetical protein RIR_jg38707.t1 [Rhizophagus irregularis DAOM 181602=DAOM 197198]|nr:hypothetical protein RIR_jg38707.t1 [Rhizophagus irregularis DAOM 181602=DAOM 197198]